MNLTRNYEKNDLRKIRRTERSQKDSNLVKRFYEQEKEIAKLHEEETGKSVIDFIFQNRYE